MIKKILVLGLMRIWTIGLNFLLTPILLHAYGAKGVALQGVLATATGIFSFLDIAVGLVVVRKFLHTAPGSERDRLLRSIGRAFGAIAAIAAIATTSALIGLSSQIQMSTEFVGSEFVVAALAISLAAAFQILINFRISILFALDCQIETNGTLALVGTLKLALPFLLVSIGIPGAAGYLVLQAFLMAAITYVLGWRLSRKNPGLASASVDWRIPLEALRESPIMTIFAVTTVVYSQLDKLIATKLGTSSQLASYSIATQLALLCAMVVGLVIQSNYSLLLSPVPPEERKARLLRVDRLVALLLLPLAVGIGLEAEWLVKTWMHKPLGDPALRTTAIFLVSAAVWTGLNQATFLLSLSAKTNQFFLWVNLGYLPVHLGLSVLLTTRYGLPGAALASLIYAMATNAALHLFLGERILHLSIARPWLGLCGRILFAGIAPAMALHALSRTVRLPEPLPGIAAALASFAFLAATDATSRGLLRSGVTKIGSRLGLNA